MAQQEMVINYVPGEECRVAIVEGGKLQELHAERMDGPSSHVGSIYVGKVVNVEPAIQAAFVDFGLEANGFLHVSDVHPQYFPGADSDETERVGKKTPRRDRPPIQDCFRRGDEVAVQVLKEGVGTKGPTVTSYLSIPGRFLVMMPQMDKVGVSRKVEDEETRRKMREILDQLELPEGFGFILRTAGMERSKAELKRDLAYLMRLWKDMEKRWGSGDKPRLLYNESDLLVRALRDYLTSDIERIVVDNEAALNRAARFLKIVAPRTSIKLVHYTGKAPIFHATGVEPQVQMIHAREVPLESGGRLVIDETEALVAIDVNSGKSRDARDSETNAYQTNCEAVDEICRQLRLRDIGGVIVSDLIDMRSAKHRRDIEQRMRDNLKLDRARWTIAPISEFGILEMTRQRMRASHESQHFADCPTCRGRGMVQRPDSMATDVVRELAALLDHDNVRRVEMVVHPRIAGELLSSKRRALSRVERTSGKHVDVRVSDAVGVDRVTFYAYDDRGDLDLTKLGSRSVRENELVAYHIQADAADANDNWAEEPASAEQEHEHDDDHRHGHHDEMEPHPIELEPTTLDSYVERPGQNRHQQRDGRGDRGGHGDRGDRGGQGGRGQQAAPGGYAGPREQQQAGGPDDQGGEMGEGGRRRRRRRRGRRGGRGGEGFEGQPGQPGGFEQPGHRGAFAGQPGYEQGGYDQPGYDQGNYDQGGDNQVQGSEPGYEGGFDESGGVYEPNPNLEGYELDENGQPLSGQPGYSDQSGPGQFGPGGEQGEGGRRRRRRRRGRRGGRGGEGFAGQPGDAGYAQQGGPEGSYPQDGYNQSGEAPPEGGYENAEPGEPVDGGYDQPAQGGYDQGGYDQGGYGQGGYGQPVGDDQGDGQGASEQGGYPSGGPGQPGEDGGPRRRRRRRGRRGGGGDRPEGGPDRAQERAPEFATDRAPERGPDRNQDRGPQRGPDRGPGRGNDRGPDRGTARGGRPGAEQPSLAAMFRQSGDALPYTAAPNNGAIGTNEPLDFGDEPVDGGYDAPVIDEAPLAEPIAEAVESAAEPMGDGSEGGPDGDKPRRGGRRRGGRGRGRGGDRAAEGGAEGGPSDGGRSQPPVQAPQPEPAPKPKAPAAKPRTLYSSRRKLAPGETIKPLKRED